MSTVHKLESVRVIVEIDDGCKGPDDNAAERAAASIRRHVDGIGYVWVERTFSDVCGFCRMTPDADEAGMPQCCEKAQAEFEAAGTSQ